MKLKNILILQLFLSRHATSPKGMAVCVSENYLAAGCFFFCGLFVELLLIKYKKTISL